MKRLILLVLFTAACSGPRSRVHDGQVDKSFDQRPTRSKYIEAIGIGAADPALPTATQRKSLSRDAAIAKAQYDLLTQVKGVRLTGGVTVEAAMAGDSVLEARVNDVLRGAEIVKTEYTDDDGCVVTMRLPRREVELVARR